MTGKQIKLTEAQENAIRLEIKWNRLNAKTFTYYWCHKVSITTIRSLVKRGVLEAEKRYSVIDPCYIRFTRKGELYAIAQGWLPEETIDNNQPQPAPVIEVSVPEAPQSDDALQLVDDDKALLQDLKLFIAADYAFIPPYILRLIDAGYVWRRMGLAGEWHTGYTEKGRAVLVAQYSARADDPHSPDELPEDEREEYDAYLDSAESVEWLMSEHMGQQLIAEGHGAIVREANNPAQLHKCQHGIIIPQCRKCFGDDDEPETPNTADPATHYRYTKQPEFSPELLNTLKSIADANGSTVLGRLYSEARQYALRGNFDSAFAVMINALRLTEQDTILAKLREENKRLKSRLYREEGYSDFLEHKHNGESTPE